MQKLYTHLNVNVLGYQGRFCILKSILKDKTLSHFILYKNFAITKSYTLQESPLCTYKSQINTYSNKYLEQTVQVHIPWAKSYITDKKNIWL